MFYKLMEELEHAHNWRVYSFIPMFERKFKHKFNYESFFFTKSLQYPQGLLMIEIFVDLDYEEDSIVMLI